jgi:hypothetical protein
MASLSIQAVAVLEMNQKNRESRKTPHALPTAFVTLEQVLNVS